jgi:hypothetical protein
MQVSDYNMVSTGSAEEMNVHPCAPLFTWFTVSNLVLEEILITVCNFLFFLGNVWIQYIPQVRFLLRSNISYRSDSCSDPIYPTGQIPAQIQYILQVRFLLISTYDLWLHFWYLQTFPLSDPWLSNTYTFFPLFIHVLFTVWLLSVDDHMTSKTLYVSDMLRHKWLLASCCTE